MPQLDRHETRNGPSEELPDVALPLMQAIEKDPSRNQRALAHELGISLGAVNYCLKALISHGFVKAENFRKNPNKAGYFYLLTPSGMHEKTNLTLRFLERKRHEYKKLQHEISALEAMLEDEMDTAPVNKMLSRRKSK